MLRKNEEAFDLVRDLIEKMDKNNRKNDRVKEIENFLYNFLLLVLSRIKLDEKTAQYRSRMIEKIR